ncbi:major facilitator superfamily domain-containing protein [Infundibulicybe gibba]|nr:major facilitator superfamily domain-containing protein [Infundibulicybe gibba]
MNLGGQELPWGSPAIICILCAAAAAFVAFIVAENRAARPIAPMYLFIEWKWRNVPIIMVARCLLFFHLFATTFYLPILLQVTGISTVAAGALVIPFLTTAAISSTFSGYICSKYGHVRPLFMLGLAVLPVGMGLMSTLNERSGIARVVGYSIVAGYAFGSGTLTSMVIAQVGLPTEVLGTVTALISTLPNLGGVLGVGIIGTIINNVFRAHLLRVPGAAQALRGLDLNDPVALRHAFPTGPMNDAVVSSYVRAWQTGCWALAGIAVAQFLMCIFIRPFVIDDDRVEGQKGGLGVGKDAEVGANAKGTGDVVSSAAVKI